MALSERLAYVLDFNVQGAVKGLEQVGKTADKELGKADQKLDKLGGNLTKFGVGAVAFAGVAGAGLMKLAGDASNLEESINAVNVTFGEAAGGVLKLGEEAARAVGLSKAEFNSLAVQFSSFATTVAGEGGNVVGTLDDLTTRAADFASVMNLDVAEAAQVFQSGLAGETEPLKKFGIDLSAAAVEAYAMANGIGTAGQAMTEAEKVQARYGLLMEQTNKTAGDFANTSGGAANQQRIFKAELANLRAEIGSGVLPMFTNLMKGATAITGAFSKLSPEAKSMVGQFAAIGVGGVALVGSLSAIAGQVIKMRGNFTDANGTLNNFGKTAKGLGTALVVGAVAYAAFGAAAQGIQGNNEWLEKDLKGVEKLLVPMQQLGKVSFGLGQIIGGTTKAQQEQISAFNESEEAAASNFASMTAGVYTMDQLKERLDESTLSQHTRNLITVEFKKSLDAQAEAEANLAEATALETAATEDAAGATKGLNQAQQDAAHWTAEYERHQNDLTEAKEEAAKATDRQRQAEENLLNFISGRLSTVFDYEQATYDLATASQSLAGRIAEVEQAHADGTLTGAEYEQALRDLRSEEIATAEQALATAEAFAESKGATADSTAGLALQKEELIRLQEQFPQLRDEIQAYIDILDRIPASKNTNVTVNGSVRAGSSRNPNGSNADIALKTGGPVPGPRDAPVPITAHGGEFVLSADVVDAVKRGGKTQGLGARGGAPAANSGAAGPIDLSDDTIARLVNGFLAGVNGNSAAQEATLRAGKRP